MAQSPFLKDSSPISNMAIPGQSLTNTPKQATWEKPAKFSQPEKFFAILMSQVKKPTARKSTANLLNVGISAETIASAMVMNAFTEGYITPDVAEIVKEPLVRVVTRIGLDAGVSEMNIINEMPKPAMSLEESYDLMKDMDPDKYEREMDKIPDYEEEDEDEMMAADEQEMPEGFITQRGEA